MKVMKEKKFSYALAMIAIGVIYFQVYWHYWLVKMLKGYVINTLLPIAILLLIFLSREFAAGTPPLVKRRKSHLLFAPLAAYVFFAMVAIFLNEDGYGPIKSYLIYIFSPVLIFASLYWMHIFRRNGNIGSALRLLVLAGIVFSVYVAVLYSLYPESVTDAPVIDTNRGEVMADTGATFGIEEFGATRYTIPGISSTTYGPILVPLVFAGLYLRKRSEGRLKRFLYSLFTLFLVFCIFKTVSRGPLFAIAAGTVYLFWRKWFSAKEFFFIVPFAVVSFLTYAKLLLFRVLITAAILFPIDISFLGDVQGLLIDSRVKSVEETTDIILQNPFFGMGMSKLVEIQNLSFGKEHNNYLSIAGSFGIFTLIFYVLFLISLYVLMQKWIKVLPEDHPEKDREVILSAGVISLVVYLNFAPAEFHFIWVWFGMAAASLRNIEDGFLMKNLFLREGMS